MKKIWKIFWITLLILVVWILLIDMIRVAWCHEPFIKVKTSCDYEDQNNNSVYKVSGIGCEYIEDSNGADNIWSILGKVLRIKACDIPAWNLTSCRIEEEILNDEWYTPIEEWTKILQQSWWNWSNKENVYPTEWLKTLDSWIWNNPYWNFSSKNREELITFESTSEDWLISRYAIYDRENHKWLFDCFEESWGWYIHVDETIDIDGVDVMSCKEKYDEVIKYVEDKDLYKEFLEAIKSSWEQPQWKNDNIPSFDELEDVVAMCPYETLWWWYDEYPVYKREFILPYKDWYVWYNYGWNNWEWWGYYLTYKSIDNPCEIISASDEFFFRYFNDRTRYINPEEPIRADNKVFLWLGWTALDVVEKELDCEMWKDINDDDTCQKEMNKYMYNLVIWKEKNDTFTKWMNYLKKSIDTNNYTTPYTWNDIEVSCYENNTWLDFLNEYWEDNKKLTEEKRKEYSNIRNKRIRECIDSFIK